MNKKEAEKIISQKIKELLHCPFCGNIPNIEYSVGKTDKSGFTGHYVSRKACCRIMGCGQVELFFTNKDSESAYNYDLWKSMAVSIVNDWNRRYK